MKNSLLILFTLLIVSGRAQEYTPEFRYLNPNQIIGVFPIDNDVIALSEMETRTTDNMDLYLVSFLNKSQTQVELAVSHDSRFMGVRKSDKGIFFVFESRDRNTLQIGQLSPNGNVLYTQYFAPEKENFKSVIHQLETNVAGNLCISRNFSIITTDATGKKQAEYGTEILTFNSQLQFLGFSRLEGKGSMINLHGTPNGFVGVYEKYDYESQTHQLDIKIYNQKAETIGNHTLAGEETFFPSEIIEHNDQIIIAGYYLSNSIFNAQKTEGLFTRILAKDGTALHTHTFPWADLKTKLKNDSRGDFIFNGEKSVMIEEIIPNQDGFQIIGESYSRNTGVTFSKVLTGQSGDKRKVVSVYDFVIFQADEEGELINANIIEKKPMNIEVTGSLFNNKDGLALEYAMKTHQVFPFKYMDNDIITYVNYQNDTGTIYQLNTLTKAITKGEKLELEPVINEEWTLSDQRTADSKILTNLDNLQTKADNMDRKVQNVVDRLEYGTEKIDYIFHPFTKSDFGYFLLNDDRVLLYRIDKERYSIFYQKL